MVALVADLTHHRKVLRVREVLWGDRVSERQRALLGRAGLGHPVRARSVNAQHARSRPRSARRCSAPASCCRCTSDATARVNIVLRVGGALGGALFAVILATGLPGGTGTAFHTAFAWLAAASLLGVAAALWLLVAERAGGGRPVPLRP